MARLSSPIENIKDHYTVIVVGSGYGGAIAASRLARAGQQVCLLERGKEFQPGEYPDTEPEALGEIQVDLPKFHLGSHTGLYDLRVNEDMNVFIGCGLGGTSLVNANVSLRAEPRAYDDPRWPQALRDDRNTLLEEGYRRAEEMLKPIPYPNDFPALQKLQALEKSAASLNEKFYRPPINVNFKDGVNHVGVQQQACKLCGDCVSGCNHSAKNTVLMNYLPDAKNHGAEIYTQVSVRRLERKDGRWLVHYQVLEAGREKFDAPSLFVSADIVILAAGTLGTTEILLRSKANGLPLSDQLGLHFTGNGDMLGFGYNCDEPINAIGLGHRQPNEKEPVGPCIAGIIDVREQPNLNDGMVIEEGSVPGALSAFLPPALAVSSGLLGKDTDAGLKDFVKERARELESLVRGAYHGAAHNTQVYLVMTHDDANGRMYLDDDRLRISWPGVGKQPIFQRVNDRLQQATKPLGGTYLKNPIWSKLTHHDLVTVHPLGGCIMAEEAKRGVVNHKHQVFSGADGAAAHEGLYVCDGSVIPRSLGVNPLLTISALAERCCALLAKDRGWHIDYKLPSAPLQQEAPQRLGIQFTETMTGHFSTQVKDDYQRAAQQGKEAGSIFEFTLTISSGDLEAMLSDANHQAKMLGTVKAPALSAEALTVTEGEFNLFVQDPERVGVRLMCYRMKLASAEGKRYYFDGFKSIHDGPGFDVWADTTTLYITVYEGDNAGSPVLGKGILKIHPADFARQMTTMQVNNAQSLAQRLGAMARFGSFFAGTVFDTFGGVLARPNVFAIDAPPRKKRALRVAAPEVYFFNTADGLQLRLTRYQGGKKGPVILAHGLGVSSLIFSIDTVETNLLEYLFAHGFDLWLLDYRASTDLPASKTQFTADDVATMDYPAAVAKVREVTGAESVQVVAHCVGSVTFFMAMLAGLQGVRAAVSSQVAANMVAPTMTRLKTGLHLPSFLDALGIDSLNAYVDNHADWLSRLYDKALQLYPIELEERCNSAVCHRITFMYSLLYEHDQLNTATHEALHEMFGVANMRIFEHLALMTRQGHLADAKGRDVYLPHPDGRSLERLAIPIAFIHGAENFCFLPESTERTFNLLCEANGKNLYKRHVIPNYGHIDCIFGKNAVKDVYPFILEHLEATK
jgi:cholesterol oxidase